MGHITVRKLTIGEGMPKVCLPIAGRTEEDILFQAKRLAKLGPDIAEFRADWFMYGGQHEKLLPILEQVRNSLDAIPLIFTFRTKAEGGELALCSKEYAALIRHAADSGLADIIDVEVFASNLDTGLLIEEIQSTHCYVIGSNHDFYKTPKREELTARLQYMKKLGTDIAKIAVMPSSTMDVIELISAAQEAKLDIPTVTISMGRDGIITRICGEILGSAITFASAGKASAPGQIMAEDMRILLDIIHKNYV